LILQDSLQSKLVLTYSSYITLRRRSVPLHSKLVLTLRRRRHSALGRRGSLAACREDALLF
jgi:hypothetical protein